MDPKKRDTSLATITVAPKSGNVGAKAAVTGSGLTKGKKYDLLFGSSKVGSFTATARGTVPSGVSFLIPETPTSGKKGEMGTKISVSAVSKSAKDPTAEATFELQASIVVDALTVYLGQSVSATATGLLPNQTYQLVMLSTSFHAFPAGMVDSDSNGSAKTVFVVPGYLGPGMYRADLMHKIDGYPALQVPPPLPVIGYSPDALIGGAPKTTNSGSSPGLVSIPFKNTTTTSLMPVVYAIVYSATKQPLQITSSVVSLPPESTGDALMSFAHLPKGKYTITSFATTSSGHVVSKMFSFPLDLS